jgi:heme-degrading monooxygenase HmoA
MSASSISNTPIPPYFAVIFTSQRTDGDNGYSHVSDRMMELAQSMPGFLGAESARSESGFGITVSYWKTEEDIRHWKAHSEHQDAQQAGKAAWYSDYSLRISRVERAYRKNENTAEQGAAANP